jgi:NAD+ synthase (glutamine-hydrolysing)
MVLTYYLAALELEKENLDGFLLVLGSSNLDESLRGYFTKYDCSSADINPIGSFSKYRLKEILVYFHSMHKFEVIKEVLTATPTAELRPLQEGEVAQTDEEDMGLTYAELCIFGKLRKIERLGPVSMFDRMYYKEVYANVEELAIKIKRFFNFYSANRHKCTILPPSFYFDPESCDDNRYDMRPFTYATDWSYQFEIIDERVKEIISKKEVLDVINRSASVD